MGFLRPIKADRCAIISGEVSHRSVLHFCTYVILDVGSGISFQQQWNKVVIFILTGVMKSRVPLLHTEIPFY